VAIPVPVPQGGCLVEMDYRIKKEGTLRIGSENFDLEDAMETLTALCKNKLASYDEYTATRDGIEHKTATSKKLSWADADRILAALESLDAK
jgi:hypothetical protein